MVWSIIIGGLLIILPKWDVFCIACGGFIDVLLGVITVAIGASAILISRNVAAKNAAKR